MAQEFDPLVQEVPANSYLRDSQAASVNNSIAPTGQATNTIMPKGREIADRSLEYEGQAAAYGMSADSQGTKGLGELFSGIVQGLDFVGKVGTQLIQKDIENQVYTGSNAAREEYTEYIESLKKNPGLQNFLNARADGGDGGEDLPAELDGLSDTLGSLSNANSQNKISNTMYYGRLLAMAKDLRTKYPGFRQYIDQQFASVTGVNPANAYITALTQDINRNMAAQGSTQKAAIAEIRKNPWVLNTYPNLLQEVQAGTKGLNDVLRVVAPVQFAKQQMEMRALRRADVRATKEDKQTEARSEIGTGTEAITNQFINNIQVKTGTDTSVGIIEFVKRANSGLYKQEVIQEGIKQIASNLPILRKQLVDEFNKQGQFGGRSATEDVGGPQERDKIINSHMSHLETYLTNMTDGKYGIAFDTANRLKARSEGLEMDMKNDPNIGPPLQAVEIIKNKGGESNLNVILLNQISQDLPKKMDTFLSNWTKELLAQTRRLKNGEYTSLNDVFKNSADNNINTARSNAEIVSRVRNGIVSKDLTPELKENLIMAAFGDGNIGFVESLNKDYVDPKTGRDVPGRYLTYRQLTSPEVLQTAKELSKINPIVWDKVQNWIEITGRNLMHTEIAGLNDMAKDKKVQVGWDPVKKNWYVDETPQYLEAKRQDPNSAIRKYEDAQIKTYKESIHRINMSIDPLKAIADINGKTDSRDVETYLFQQMRSSNLRPSDQMKGIPMLDAIVRANAELEAKKKTNQERGDEWLGTRQ